jgi:hypothetical protein
MTVGNGIGKRRDRFLIRARPEHVLELAANPSRFPEFNPLVRVPQPSGRVEEVGNVYHQLLGIGPVRLTMRWETIRAEPADLPRSPRPTPPWTTVELGTLPLLGPWTSTTRYDAVPSGTLVTHELEYQLPPGTLGRVVDTICMRPTLAVGLGVLIRRLCRWIELSPSAPTSPRA